MQFNSAIWPGKSYPLGATWDGHGVNFAIFSEHASLVQLCIFNNNHREINRINLRWNDEGVWHAYLPQAKPGLIYGYRAHGEFDPGRGLYFNPAKLLLDPYAKLVTGSFTDHPSLYCQSRPNAASKSTHPQRDGLDSAPYVAKSVVADTSFNWKDDCSPGTALKNSIIYEMHVKGFTMKNPRIPHDLRGTYSGLAHPEAISHLRSLGITAVELLPIQLSFSEPRLTNMGLTNYWGYNTLGFFTPDPRYAATDNAVSEFQSMVYALHDAGIEVILDVVYNHTAEQGQDGPCLCYRGLDNPTYYKLNQHDASEYENFSGCGNTVDTRNPRTLQLIADSLRYWVEVMHVDGFRFDLASTLARTGSSNEYRQQANFLAVLAQDPLLAKIKLIAEPWDCGPNGYQVGSFPKGWSEWNGDWRDTIRKYWKGDSHLLGKLACKLSGSSDLYWDRSPLASINFVTAHDGFTLRDLVTYQNKQNQANREDNRDGANDNWNWNCGHEGPSSNPHIQALRARQQRNLMLTLLLSQGVPMITAGDEINRTQQGNNNAYCQDNSLSYLNWDLDESAKKMLAFTQRVISLRRRHPAFKRSTFFRGESEPGGLKDIIWLNTNGKEMDAQHWNGEAGQCLSLYIAGDCLDDTDYQGLPLHDYSFLLILNAHNHAIDVTIPRFHTWAQWDIIVDTACFPDKTPLRNNQLHLPSFSAVLLAEMPRTS